MKILVCDDEPLARQRLVRMLEKIPDTQCVGEAENGDDLLSQCEQLMPDVVISDIRMPGMDGLEAANHIARMPQPPALIFCTAFDEHALQAFRVRALAYLLKPVKQAELQQALENICKPTRAQLAIANKTRSSREHITVRTHRGLEWVRVDDIGYFMADNKYVTIRTAQHEFLIDESLKELADEFEQEFVRIHRNCLINKSFLEAIEQKPNAVTVRLRGIDERLLVSRRLLPNLRKLIKT